MQLILKSILLTTATFLTVPAIAGGFEVRLPVSGLTVQAAETPLEPEPAASPNTVLFVDFNERIVDTTGKSVLSASGISFSNVPGPEGTAGVFNNGTLYATNPEFELGAQDFSLEWWQKGLATVAEVTLGQPQQYSSIAIAGSSAYFSAHRSRWTHSFGNLQSVDSGTWTHVVIMRDSGTLAVAVNGVIRGSTPIEAHVVLRSDVTGTTLNFGRYFSGAHGQFDQLKFTVGASAYKYGVPFTPSSTLTP